MPGQMMAGRAAPRLIVSDWMPQATGLDSGQRVCVIGDVHGLSANLSTLLEFLGRAPGDSTENVLVFLGDLIDRGPDSLGAVDLAMQARTGPFTDVIWLMGNHEQMMRLALEERDEYSLDLCQMNGSRSFWKQLGVGLRNHAAGAREFTAELAAALGPERLDWLESLRSHARFGHLLFVHAGINHNISLKQHFDLHWSWLADDHWAWIRYDFLDFPVSIPDLLVIHGHTPVRQDPTPDFSPADFLPHSARHGKINLDGGSYASGCVIGAEFTQAAWRLAAAVDMGFVDHF